MTRPEGVPMQDGYRRVGLIVEHVRAWGRRVCEGVAAAAQGLENWELRMIEPRTTVRTADLRGFDGFESVVCYGISFFQKKALVRKLQFQ